MTDQCDVKINYAMAMMRRLGNYQGDWAKHIEHTTPGTYSNYVDLWLTDMQNIGVTGADKYLEQAREAHANGNGHALAEALAKAREQIREEAFPQYCKCKAKLK